MQVTFDLEAVVVAQLVDWTFSTLVDRGSNHISNLIEYFNNPLVGDGIALR